MNDNYLWDKSGKPDEEIQHLESLLSEFRYQPRPLVLPEAEPERLPKASTMVGAKVTIFSFVNTRFAALAAMALLVLGLGIWWSVRPTANRETIAQGTPTPTTTPTVAPPESIVRVAPESPAAKLAKHTQMTAPKVHLARYAPKRMPKKSLQEEGELAKEKVLYALQITSEKLNLISKKIQTDTN